MNSEIPFLTIKGRIVRGRIVRGRNVRTPFCSKKNTYFKEYSGIGRSGGFSYRQGGANRPPRPFWLKAGAPESRPFRPYGLPEQILVLFVT